MKLLSIEIENYKSLKSVKINDFSALNIFVGPNGAGKTNFSEALVFLGDLLRGGIEVAKKYNFEQFIYPHSDYISFNITFTSKKLKGYIVGYSCKIMLEYSPEHGSILIGDNPCMAYTQDKFIVYHQESGSVVLNVEKNKDNHLQISYEDITEMSDEMQEIVQIFENVKKSNVMSILNKSQPLLFSLTLVEGFFKELVTNYLSNIRHFQVNAEEARHPSAANASTISKYGGNIAAVFKLYKDKYPDLAEKIMKFMKLVMPDLKSILPMKMVGNKYDLLFEEDDNVWQMEQVSDGTIRIFSLLLAMTDPKDKFIIIEEPENNVHSQLLIDFYHFCREIAEQKQIFITTHSIVLLNHLHEDDKVYVVYKSGSETKIKAILDFEGAKDSLEYELIGDFIFSGGIKEYMPWHREVKDE